ncbi:hypothetical protein DL98DRAFT_513977 [Cadophora sp. DSE1049]|nr:hypothetical protein DL98DRAFT_513977 [Cadophora sp. DSE1049]
MKPSLNGGKPKANLSPRSQPEHSRMAGIVPSNIYQASFVFPDVAPPPAPHEPDCPPPLPPFCEPGPEELLLFDWLLLQ